MPNYSQTLSLDLVEQFRGQPNIDALVEVLAKQLSDVFEFYKQLRFSRWLESSEGKQLDGIGDIVCLTRAQAAVLSGKQMYVMEDEDYRNFLAYKIMLNTTHTTYPDIISSIRMFYDKPLYYSEDLDKPATIIFTAEAIKSTEEAEKLSWIPVVKAAGVGWLWRIRATPAELPLYAGCGVHTCKHVVISGTAPEPEYVYLVDENGNVLCDENNVPYIDEEDNL